MAGEARGIKAGLALLVSTLLVCLLALSSSQVALDEHNVSLDIADLGLGVPNAEAKPRTDASALDDVDLPSQHGSSLACGAAAVSTAQCTAPAGIVGASILQTAPKTSPPSV